MVLTIQVRRLFNSNEVVLSEAFLLLLLLEPCDGLEVGLLLGFLRSRLALLRAYRRTLVSIVAVVELSCFKATTATIYCKTGIGLNIYRFWKPSYYVGRRAYLFRCL